MQTQQWMTKQQAAARLQKTERRIEQLVAERTLIGEKRVNPEGGRDVLYIQAGSVERYGNLKRAERATGSTALVKQALAIQTMQNQAAENAISLSQWLTLDQAAERARGLSAQDLLDMILSGHLPAWLARGSREKHGAIDRYRVKLSDLEGVKGQTWGREAAGSAK